MPAGAMLYSSLYQRTQFTLIIIGNKDVKIIFKLRVLHHRPRLATTTTQECAVLYSTTKLKTTTIPQTTKINYIHSILAYLVECAIVSLMATSYYAYLDKTRSTIFRMEPNFECSFWLHALDRNGEYFPTT